jgi:hypothetical protein
MGNRSQRLLTLEGDTNSTYILDVYLDLVVSSSDLWVAGSVSGAQSTGKTSGVNYAVGGVQGTSISEYLS